MNCVRQDTLWKEVKELEEFVVELLEAHQIKDLNKSRMSLMDGFVQHVQTV